MTVTNKLKNIAKKIQTFTKQNPVKSSLAVLGLTGVLAAGSFSFYRMGEEIYEGMLEGRHVTYIEYNYGTNTMLVKKGSTSLQYLDNENPTKIEWNAEKEPEYIKDVLEIVKDKNKGREHNASSIGNETLEGIAAKNILDKSSVQYNAFRKLIRDKKREEYQQSVVALESFFQ